MKGPRREQRSGPPGFRSVTVTGIDRVKAVRRSGQATGDSREQVAANPAGLCRHPVTIGTLRGFTQAPPGAPGAGVQVSGRPALAPQEQAAWGPGGLPRQEVPEPRRIRHRRRRRCQRSPRWNRR